MVVYQAAHTFSHNLNH